MQDFKTYDYKISAAKIAELVASGISVVASINGEHYEVFAPEPIRKITIQEYLCNLSDTESSYDIWLVDGDTGEIVYAMTSAYALPPCFAELKVRKSSVDYFDKMITLEI